MKKQGNCQIYGHGMKGSEQSQCPFLRFPLFKSGYTGKRGPHTWFNCAYKFQFIRDIKSCNLAGDPEAQREEWIRVSARQ